MENYGWDGAPWYSQQSSIISVIIENGVTNIGSYAFQGCTNLTNVTIPNSIASIGNYAFNQCRSLADVAIPNSVTSIGSWTFYGCNSLTSVTIPDSITSIEVRAFASCTNLTEILVSTENTEYCDENGVLFSKDKTELICYPAGKDASTFEIPDGVTKIGDAAFEDCYTLVNVTIPDSVTIFGAQAFSSCGIKNITIPSSVVSIETQAFTACYRLTEILVSTDNPAFCSVDGVLFNNDKTELLCYPAGNGSSSYVVPNGVTKIGNYSFQACYGLEEIILPDGIASIGVLAFNNCAITSIILPSSVISIDRYAFEACNDLTSVTIPVSVTSIGYAAFASCYSLTDVYYGANETEWNAIEIGDGNECLTSATIHYSSVSDTGGTGDSGDTGDTGGTGSSGSSGGTGSSGGGDSSKVVDALDVLEYEIDENGNVTITGCDTSANGRLEIPNTIEDCPVTTISDGAFQNCTLLTDVVIPDSVTYVWHGAFQNCTSLANITLPQTPAWIGSEAFENTAYYNDSANWSGDALYLDNYLLRVETDATGTYTIADGTICIGYGALMDCSGVTGVSIPDTVKLIGVEAFARTGITSAVIPEGVEKMDEVAFGGCALTSLYLPRSLTWIGADMCESLEAIYYAGIEVEWAAVYIDDFWNTAFMSAPVYFLGEESGVSVPGDLNGDGEVNASDLTILARHVGKVETMEDEAYLANADVTGDGNVDASDLTKLAQYVGKIISALD
ncbi:MAG: leucine-rich repeat protein [Oscillospiraceae bacterium]|nr:leucine-rich repeat protein [Oscillospiraceae bacterium]